MTTYRDYTITESNEVITFNGVDYVEKFTIRNPDGELVDNQDEETIEACMETIDEIIRSEGEPLSDEDLEYNAREDWAAHERENG